MELNNVEKMLNEQQLFFKWLTEGRVDFISLVAKYVSYLEAQKQNLNAELSNYTTVLGQWLDIGKVSSKNIYVKDKTIGMLVAYERYKTAPIHEKWEKYIKEHNINTDKETVGIEIYKKEE